MKKEELASILNNRRLSKKPIKQEEIAAAFLNNLVIVYPSGWGDDTEVHFKGAMDFDEIDFSQVCFTADGKTLNGWEEREALIKFNVVPPFYYISPIHHKKRKSSPRWEIITDIPCARFSIIRKDGSLFCECLVFSIDDLGKPSTDLKLD